MTGVVSGRPAPRLIAVGTAVPDHTVTQAEVRGLAERLFSGTDAGSARLMRVFDHSGISTRHLCMPIAWYETPRSFAEQNALYVTHALRLAIAAAAQALERCGLFAADIDHIVVVSTTGIATPSLDARVALALGCREDVRRTPVWGLGCAGGAAGLARARDFGLADPTARVLLVAVELCSLTFRPEDRDKRNLIATSLFADGAAAVIVQGASAPAPPSRAADPIELLGSHSTLWPDTLGVMGWTVSTRGLHVVFSRDIPSIVRERVRPALEPWLAKHGLTLADVPHLASHPGGAKVLAAYAEALGRESAAFSDTYEILRTHGNMSSPTCLFVLERMLTRRAIAVGEHVLCSALGPGFAAEYVLARGASWA